MTEYGKFLSAEYANEDGTAIIVQTEHMGAVLVSEERAELWALLQIWRKKRGNVIAPMPNPDPVRTAKPEIDGGPDVIA